MKIIDLLINITNVEKLPKKIIYRGKEFDLHYADNKEELPFYIDDVFSLMHYINNFYQLNDEVEIIEYADNIKQIRLSELNNKVVLETNTGSYTVRMIDIEIINKINELISEVNELKEVRDEQ